LGRKNTKTGQHRDGPEQGQRAIEPEAKRNPEADQRDGAEHEKGAQQPSHIERPGQADNQRRGGKPAGDRPAAPAIELPADAAARFALLRQWRADTAREQNVPAYVIFHDATLRAIALEQPRDLVALARIGGVGVGKLERYGSELIAALEAAA
jgi:superfamily II DNA helicase RecQ